MSKLTGIWYCKVGETDQEELPPGSDLPMRQAVREAFKEITGHYPKFIFSGWNAELTKGEQGCVDEGGCVGSAFEKIVCSRCEDSEACPHAFDNTDDDCLGEWEKNDD